ncbi:hypothetical protein EJ02DRAFT_411304 [Clathrospora elynae]|uniref:Uncharacterized protein n=1 Tax=Clathrospora elynae TaxID=706981 RepID=A0A6A5SEV2_9PLEO|nr:hypothetical protein EJ02DRAFT_411304 [Clathrospora elynae]
MDNMASDEDRTKCTNKGAALMRCLAASDQTAGNLMGDKRIPPSAASQFHGDLKQELQNWYWRERNPTSGRRTAEWWQFPRAMQALGLNLTPTTQGGDNATHRVEHWDREMRDEKGNQVLAINQWYNVPGIERHEATRAHYDFGVNAKGGAIFGFFLESPQASARALWYGGSKEPDPADLPQLRAFSDVLWGYWSRDNADVKNIRYLLMVGICNDMTNQLIDECLCRKNAELREWPGTDFEADTEEGHALIGSPNGAVFAYFLMQHKAELGQKTISKVTVFRPETEDSVEFVDTSLVFHVIDSPEITADDKEKSVVKVKEIDMKL